MSDPGHLRWLGGLLAFAYPDRIARQRRAGGADYRLANGRAAQFGELDVLMKHYWSDDPLVAEPTARAKPCKAP